MKLSMPLQIVIAVALGSLLGIVFPSDQLGFLSDLGKVFIHWVKLIAGPFLFCTILIAIIQVDLSWKHGLRVVGIALLNTSFALLLSMVLSFLFFQNMSLQGLDFSAASPDVNQGLASMPADLPGDKALALSGFTKTFMPSSLFSPFVNNDILLIALLALIFGIAVRSTETLKLESRNNLVRILEMLQSAIAVILHWIIKIIPMAVFAIIAATVSKYGFEVFYNLSKFVFVVALGFALQIILVYGTWIVLIAKISLQKFVRAVKTPVLYALGVNSSLATLPLTLLALKELKVSDRSASLGAGVATNLNNDGIVLYEAMAVIFISYVYGLPTDPVQMLTIALTCIVASVGITGIPEAGFISLSVTVGVLGLPLEVLPLLLSVDWILARLRSAVNVLSDMTLSIAMDTFED